APGREMRISGVSDCWRGVAAPLPWRDSISAPRVTGIVSTRLGHLDPQMFALVLFGSPGLTPGAFLLCRRYSRCGGLGTLCARAALPRARYHSWRAIMNKLSVLGIIVGAALLSAAPFSLQWSQKNVALSLDSADARVGRPLTATSVAGVNRRVHRRAYRRGYYYY